MNISVNLYIKTSTEEWADIASDIVSSIKYNYGIKGITPSDRIANIGKIQFTLNNTDKKFSPDYSITGSSYNLGKSTLLYLVVTNEDSADTGMKFYGRIDKLVFKNDIGMLPIVEVTALDIMNELSNTPLPILPMSFNITFHNAVNTVLGEKPSIGGLGGYTLGDEGKTFEVVFDGDSKSTMYSELNKLALSELGYIYAKNMPYWEPTVVDEPSDGRYGDYYTTIPLYLDDSGRIQTEESAGIPSYVLTEDGVKLVLGETSYTDIIDNMQEYKVVWGDNQINQIKIKTYPRHVDSASSVLFTLDNPIELQPSGTSGSEVIRKISYADPSGGDAKCAGKDMITPVRSTDYLMNLQEDGGGFDLSANLTVTVVDMNGDPADFGAYGAFYKMVNTGIATGYITRLWARGTGVYFYNPVEVYINDADSVASYGVVEEKIDQKYISDSTGEEGYARLLIGREKTPRRVLHSITFLANTTPYLMQSYLYNDIRDLIHVTITEQGISNAYFIQNITANITLDGLIYVTYGLLDNAYFTTSFFTLDDASLGMLNTVNVLGF